MFTRKLGWSSLLIAVLLTVTAVPGWAGNCSLKTLKGSYGFSEEGSIVVQFPGFPPPPLPFVTSGTIFYDGNGNLSGEDVTSLNGLAFPGTFTGTYTVNPDCTYADEFTTVAGALHTTGTIVGDGMLREILDIETDPGVVAVATVRKTPVGKCSLETLKGSYGVLEQGTIVAPNPSFPPIPTPFDVVLSANATFDGAGHVSGTYTASFGGTTVPGTFTGTYEVTADCAYSDDFTPVPGGPLHHTGVITGEGISQDLLYVYADAGAVISGTAKQQ